MQVCGSRLFAIVGPIIVILALGTSLTHAAEPHQQQSTTPVSFDIPPQMLTDALVAFSAQTGLQVLYEGPIAQDVQSQGVTGSLTPTEALQRLLAGTG